LQACEVEGRFTVEHKGVELVEVHTIQEGDERGLEDRDSRPLMQGVQVPVPVQVLMHWAIPLPRILIESRRIPKVLVKLPIREPGQLRIEVQDEVEDEKKHREVQGHDGDVPSGEVGEGIVPLVSLLEKQAAQRDYHFSCQLVCHELSFKLGINLPNRGLW